MEKNLKKNIYVYKHIHIYNNHFAAHLKRTQHCKFYCNKSGKNFYFTLLNLVSVAEGLNDKWGVAGTSLTLCGTSGILGHRGRVL